MLLLRNLDSDPTKNADRQSEVSRGWPYSICTVPFYTYLVFPSIIKGSSIFAHIWVCINLNRYFIGTCECVLGTQPYRPVMCVVLGQVLHRISHLRVDFLGRNQFPVFLSALPSPCHPKPTSDVVKKTLKLFLGLRPDPASGDYPLLGVAISIGNSWGPLKQNKNKKKQGLALGEMQRVQLQPSNIFLRLFLMIFWIKLFW